ncbi:MAG: hypothetical protein ACK5LY_03840 [Lachnospirales bacterium]
MKKILRISIVITLVLSRCATNDTVTTDNGGNQAENIDTGVTVFKMPAYR